jgi:hypothetical protein
MSAARGQAGDAAGAAGSFFQVGYVCTNLERAMQSFTGRDGDRVFLVIDVAGGLGVENAPVRRIGLAYANGLNIEVIEVAEYCDAFFSDALPETGHVGFHHLGYRVPDAASWAALKTRAAATKSVAMDGDVPGVLHYLYIDRRADLGHYLEYIYLEDGGRALFDSVPQNRLSASGA